MNKRKRILVLGATGNLGAPTALYLSEHGYDVVAVGHRKDDNGFFAEHGMQYISMDITRPEDYDRLPQSDIDAVVQFAGELPSRYAYDPGRLLDTITKGTLLTLEYMRRIGCRRIIFPQTPYDIIHHYDGRTPLSADLSRSFPHGGDHAVYAIAKNAAADLMELYKDEYGIDYFILRFFTIYEYHPNPYHYRDFRKRLMPFRMLMKRAERSLPICVWGNCEKAKETVYIKDFTRLVERCIASDGHGGYYNVGNGVQTSLRDQILGIVEVFSPQENPSPVTYDPAKPDPLTNAFDISKTVRELDWRPQYSYLDQLRDFKAEMQRETFARLWGRAEDYDDPQTDADELR